MNISVTGSDAALLNAIRSGDPGAYDMLRARHAAAAERLARHLPRGEASADDIAGWAFAQVLDAIRRGGGPTDAFRPYLLAAVRRAARDCDAGRATPVPVDAQDIPDPGQLTAPRGARKAGGDAAVAAAFLSLPERWRAVLWHTEIEGAEPAAVATLFGLSEAEAADLAASARDGLARSAGGAADVASALRSHVAPLVLGQASEAYLAETAEAAQASSVTAPADAPGEAAHLPSLEDTIIPVAGLPGLTAVTADEAPAQAPGAGEPAGRRRSAGTQPHPSAVGSAAAMGGLAAAAATAQPSADSWPAAGAAARPGASGSRAEQARNKADQARKKAVGLAAAGVLAVAALAGAIARQVSGRVDELTPRQRSAAAGGAGLVAIAIIVGATLTLASGGPGKVTAAQQRPVAAPGTSAPASSSAPAVPSPKPRPKPKPKRPAPVSAVPAVAPAPPPPPAARLTAQVSVVGPMMFARFAAVNFTISDAGSAGTASDVRVAVSLPAGVSVVPGSGRFGGWSCSAASPGAVCVHAPLGAGAASSDILSIFVDPATACNMSVQLSATAGGASPAFAAARISCARSGAAPPPAPPTPGGPPPRA